MATTKGGLFDTTATTAAAPVTATSTGPALSPQQKLFKYIETNNLEGFAEIYANYIDKKLDLPFNIDGLYDVSEVGGAVTKMSALGLAIKCENALFFVMLIEFFKAKFDTISCCQHLSSNSRDLQMCPGIDPIINIQTAFQQAQSCKKITETIKFQELCENMIKGDSKVFSKDYRSVETSDAKKAEAKKAEMKSSLKEQIANDQGLVDLLERDINLSHAPKVFG